MKQMNIFIYLFFVIFKSCNSTSKSFSLALAGAWVNNISTIAFRYSVSHPNLCFYHSPCGFGVLLVNTKHDLFNVAVCQQLLQFSQMNSRGQCACVLKPDSAVPFPRFICLCLCQAVSYSGHRKQHIFTLAILMILYE